MKFQVTRSTDRFINKPIKIRINSLEDLERLQKENNGLELIVDFNEGYIEIHVAGEDE